MSSPNRDALVRIAGILGPITGELVFVGGRVAELLVTEPGTTRVRPTEDSDAICQVATRTEYHRLGERLRAVGFREDQTPGAPLCRWRHGEDILDVMPVDGELLGFQNAWYRHAVRLASDFEVEPGVVIRIASAPVFLATKWDAFSDRGAGDWYGSTTLKTSSLWLPAGLSCWMSCEPLKGTFASSSPVKRRRCSTQVWRRVLSPARCRMRG